MEFGELEYFQHAGLNCAIAQSRAYNGRVFHNGYVQIPPGHPWHGTDWDTCNCECPGGVTYGTHFFPSDSEENRKDVGKDWVLGFDTNHSWDNEQSGSYAVVHAAVLKMAEDCAKKQREKEEAFEAFLEKWRSENYPEQGQMPGKMIYFVDGTFACWIQGNYRGRLFVHEAREAGFLVEIRS